MEAWISIHSSNRWHVRTRFEDIFLLIFPYWKYCNRLRYFLYVEVLVMSQYICMSMLKYWSCHNRLRYFLYVEVLKFSLSLCFSINDIFWSILFCVKCCSSALFFIHVFNKLYKMACTRVQRGQVRHVAITIPYILGCTLGVWQNTTP